MSQANVKDWTATSVQHGGGHDGGCCGEVDLFEGNIYAASFSAHLCSTTDPTRCENDDCGVPDPWLPSTSFCDADGCDWNSCRLGNTSFYGPGGFLDTTKSFTVVTRFITDDGTDNGNLVEMFRTAVCSRMPTPSNRTHHRAQPITPSRAIIATTKRNYSRSRIASRTRVGCTQYNGSP